MPLQEHQSKVELKVFQGESRDVSDNVLLGSLDVSLPRLPREKQEVLVRFTYDINGLLEVEATIAATGVKESLVIEKSPGSMSQDEIRRSLSALEKLKIHPRDETENAALLARLKRLFELHLQERRAWVSQLLAMFEGALEGQNPREIARTRAEIAKRLDAFEGTPQL
jgi:molecular chaperone HscC